MCIAPISDIVFFFSVMGLITGLTSDRPGMFVKARHETCYCILCRWLELMLHSHGIKHTVNGKLKVSLAEKRKIKGLMTEMPSKVDPTDVIPKLLSHL